MFSERRFSNPQLCGGHSSCLYVYIYLTFVFFSMSTEARGSFLAFYQRRMMAVSLGAVLCNSEDPALNLGQAPGLWRISGTVICRVSVHKRGKNDDYEFRLVIIILYVWLKPHVSTDLYTHDRSVASLKMSSSLLLCVSINLTNTLGF
uniref:Uncharacterized protein n=1 Tax=Ixodes ricinus TaxID=34613 RepID=A0A6B0UV45_IXORI